MRNRIYRTIVFVARRSLILYLGVALLIYLCAGSGSLRFNIQAAAMSRFIPDFSPLVEFIRDPQRKKRTSVREFLPYFKRVSELIPTARAEAYGLSGFCHYYLGEPRMALKDMRRAAFGQPEFFYYQYNLGVLYFQFQDYPMAIHHFQGAISRTLEDTFEFLTSSKFNKSILLHPSAEELRENIMTRFYRAFYHAHLLMALSYQRQKQYAQMYYISIQALHLKLNDTGVFYFLSAVAAYHLGQYSQALQLFNSFLNFNPNYAPAYEYLAMTFKALGENPERIREAVDYAQFLRKIGAPEVLFPDEIHLQVF